MRRARYFNASRPDQDDLRIISSYVAYVADDFGDTEETAYTLDGAAVATGGVVQQGVIGRTGDTDVFRLWAKPGTLQLRLDLLPVASSGAGWELPTSNLNSVLTLRFPDGTTRKWASEDLSLLSGAWAVQVPSQGLHYISVQGASLGANATVGFTAYGSLGQYALGVAGDWEAPSLRCLAPAYTLSLPVAGKACGDPATLPQAALFEANTPVDISPPLPAVFLPGHDVVYNITSVAGSPSCTVRVTTKGCNPPVCKSLTLQLPQPGGAGSDGCGGTAVSASALYSGPVVSVSPPLPGVLPPGRHEFNVSNEDGSCTASATVAPCPPTCTPRSVQLPQPGGNCSGAALALAELVDAKGVAVTAQPPLPALVLPGTTSFVLRNSFGGECAASVEVARCAACRHLRVKVVRSSKASTSKAWRVSKVLLEVTDGNGDKVGGVALQAEWEHVPAGGGAPAFPKQAAKATSSTAKRALGTLTLRAPRAVPFGGSLVLSVAGAAAKNDPSCDLAPGALGALATFTCGARGCA